jgi:16S rRNA (guanine966-N2)-methyltransferase
LRAVPGTTTRPISDRVKEALFNILGPDILGASVLDLFAGTGSVGIEALSRGAERVVFVETLSKATATIRDNLRNTRLEANAQVVRADVFQFLAREPEMFDLIYVAPPQYQQLWAQTLFAIDTRAGWLSQDGLVVVQVFPKEFEPHELRSMRLIDQRKYGSTLLCFFESNH